MSKAAASAPPDRVTVDAKRPGQTVARIFVALGIAPADADIVADDLVRADLEGVSSHGVMLMPMYVERILKGSVSKRGQGDVVSDIRTAIVIDAGDALGQLTAHQAVTLTTGRAKEAISMNCK